MSARVPGHAPRAASRADSRAALLARVIGHRQFVAATLVCGVLLRIAWIVIAASAAYRPASDSAWYMARGASIAAGQGYAIGATPTAYWPVGYPAFLGILFKLFGPAPVAAMAANVVLQALALMLAYVVARGLFKSENVGRITLLLMAIYPNQIAYSSLLMSENLLLPLMLLGVALLLAARGRPAPVALPGFAAGLAFGFAALVKPQALMVPAITLVWIWFRSGAEKRAARWWMVAVSAGVAALLVLLPWMLRNQAVYGSQGIISNNDGINLLIGNNPVATGAYGAEAVDSLIGTSGNEHERNARARDLAMDYITSHPLRTLALLPRKLWYLYRADTEGFTLNVRAMDDDMLNATIARAMKVVAEIFWLALLALSAASIWAHRAGLAARAGIRMPALPLWIILYFTAIALVYFGDGRFHFPAAPWIVMYASAFIAAFVNQGTESVAGQES